MKCALSFHKFILLLLNLTLIGHTIAASESPQAFTFQGRLFDSSGTTPLTELISIKLQIYNPSANCLLYQEAQTVNTTSTNGVFSISVGSATGSAKRTAGTDPGLTMAAIFKNDTATATRAAGANCAAGYTPTAGDVRLLRVTITPSSTGTPETLSPDQTINSVPHAIVAETLQGLLPSAFIQKDAVYVTDANVNKLFGSLVDGVVDASDLHTHDDRYVQLSSTSAQDFGTGGYNTTGASSVGSATNFTNTILSVKTTADNKVGLAVRANAVTQSADLFQVQDNSGTALMSVSSAGAISSAASTITSTAGNQLTVKYDTTNKMTLNVSSAGVSSFTAAGSSPLIALLGGDVGIGTSSPDRPLHVTSASAPTILQENTAAGADQKIRYSTTTTSGDMAWGKFTDNMSSSTEHMRLMSSGNLGVGVTNATAVLHLKAGTATASTAPLKFTSGTLLSTPEDGAIEFLSPDFYATSAGTRYKIALISGTGDFTSVTNSSGAITLSAGGTNQNVTLSPSGTGVVTTSSPTTITNATASTSSSTGALVVSGGVGVGGDIFTAGNVSSGGVFLSPLGAAATPSYSFTGDTNTGVFSPASDTWAVSTAGSERVRVTSSGYVGIGTTAPTVALQITSATPVLKMSDSTSGAWTNFTQGGGVFQFESKATTGAILLDLNPSPQDGTSSGTIRIFRGTNTTGSRRLQIYRGDNSTTVDAQIEAGTSGTTFFAANGGNVGVGTATPGARLQVSKTDTTTSGTNYGIMVTSTYNQAASTASNTDLLINRTETSVGSGTQILLDTQVGGTTKFNVDNSGNGYFAGNLGIGVTSPSSALHAKTTDAATNTVVNVASFSHATSGTPAANYGTSIDLRGNDATVADRQMFLINSYWSNATDASRSARTEFYGPINGSSVRFLQMGRGNTQITEAITSTASTTPSAAAYGLSLINTDTTVGNVSKISLLSENTSKSAWIASASNNLYLGTNNGGSAMTGMTILDSSGNVGIGTVSPAQKLQVDGNIRLGYSADSTNYYLDMRPFFTGTATQVGYKFSTYGNGGVARDVLTILDTGKVGIGTTSPAAALDIGAGGRARMTSAADSTKYAEIYHNGSYTVVDASWGAVKLNPSVLIQSTNISSQGIFGSTGQPLRLGSNGTPDYIRIDTAGNVGIGTTTPGYKLQVGAAADGSEARANAWNILSDERLKKNFQAIPNALDKILSLNGYFYQWNKGPDQKRKLGLKAQEVEKVFPEIVSQGKDGYKSVSYDHLIAPVINAIKELFTLVKGNDQKVSREIASIKEENTRLKASDLAKDQKIKDLEKRLELIEKKILLKK
ncbi:MAG: tail fiber domain-containing protein [Bacteriovoracaceae bacterium]